MYTDTNTFSFELKFNSRSLVLFNRTVFGDELFSANHIVDLFKDKYMYYFMKQLSNRQTVQWRPVKYTYVMFTSTK